VKMCLREASAGEAPQVIQYSTEPGRVLHSRSSALSWHHIPPL
jgi:hypothetical protein